MEADHDIVLLHHFFDCVDGVHGFGRDGAQSHCFRELKQLARLGFVFGNRDDSVVDGFDFVVGAKDGKRALTVRDNQHEYVFVEVAP